jgi:phosphoribosylformimino-5-aminoimidazole carboxamide ribotide isomerase
MRVIPVLDLMGGVVVRGVGGRRHEYRPIVSTLTSSCRPVDVAEAFRAHFGLTDLYLADLDAIGGAQPALPLYGELRRRGFRLWVDAGLRDAATAEVVAATGVERIVAGLETLTGPEALAAICRQWGERVVFSLDLREGRPLGNVRVWGEDTWTIAGQALAAGARWLLLLDLARVGSGTGAGTEALCARLKAASPQVQVAAGGGIRDRADLERLRDAGVEAALVASALHDGRLCAGDIQAIAEPSSRTR